MDDRDRLWDGDRGTLPLKVRAVIGRLESDYAVDDASRFEGESVLDIIGEYREDVERVLSDSLLVLVKNDRYHVAWAEPAKIEGRPEARCAKASVAVSNTLAYAMCACKEAALEAEAAGSETCTIDAEWLLGRLSEMRSWRNGRDAKRLQAAADRTIDRMCELRLLRHVRGTDEYEVRPLLSAIVDEAWLRELAEAEDAAADGDTGTDEDAEAATVADDGALDVDAGAYHEIEGTDE